MIACCIDVGLRNLAFNVMDSEYNILLWDIYNVLNNDEYYCKDLLKNGKICNKKCNMKYEIKDEMNYCCKRHFPKNIKITKKNDFKIKKVDEYLLQDIAKAFIINIENIYNNNKVFKILTHVYIELQPKCNSKMLFISHILYGKLVELYNKQNTIIRFVRASQKLKAYTGPIIECKLKGKYAQRKWLSIQYTRWFLQNKISINEKEKWLFFFDSKKIQADLADTFLMSINSITGIPNKHLKHKNGNDLK